MQLSRGWFYEEKIGLSLGCKIVYSCTYSHAMGPSLSHVSLESRKLLLLFLTLLRRCHDGLR